MSSPTSALAPPAMRAEADAIADRWLCYAPQTLNEATHLVVCVHGVTRKAVEQFEAFQPLARRTHSVLLAPVFDPQRYPRYQRLGPPGARPADRALLEAVELLRRRLGPALDAGRFSLFGHSGGAQFVHRFVLAHPERVRRYVVSAAGWYTLPDPALDYPLGLRGAPAGIGMDSLQRALHVPGKVFVGAEDIRHGRHLRRGELLDALQGTNRLSRAHSWTTRINALARVQGLPPPLELTVLPGGAHSFRGLARRCALHERAWQFLLPSASS